MFYNNKDVSSSAVITKFPLTSILGDSSEINRLIRFSTYQNSYIELRPALFFGYINDGPILKWFINSFFSQLISLPYLCFFLLSYIPFIHISYILVMRFSTLYTFVSAALLTAAGPIRVPRQTPPVDPGLGATLIFPPDSGAINTIPFF